MTSDQNKSKTELIAELRELREEKAQLERQQRNVSQDEERLRKFFQKAPLGYQSLDEWGHLLQVNNTWLHLLGYKREEILGEDFNEFLSEEWKTCFLKDFAQLKTCGAINGKEYRLVRKDGSHITVSFYGSFSPDGQSKFGQVHCVLLDVTERTKLLERLRAKERFLNAILESVQDGISVIDADLNICRVNDVMRQWALSDEALKGRKCYEAYRGASCPCSPCCALRSLRTAKTEHAECAGPPGSSAKWIEVASHPMKHPESGQVEYVVEFVRDITQRKQAEEALRESKQRFQWAMEASRDGLWDWDLTTDEVYYSPAYAAMLEYTTDEIPHYANFWWDHILPEDKEAAIRANKECIENLRKSFEIEFRMRTKNGDTRWILGRGMAVARDEQGWATRLVGTHADITERKQAEEHLRYQKQLLETITNEMQDVLAIQYPDYTIERYNRAGQEMLGLSPEDAKGRKCFQLIGRSEECRVCATRQALENREPARMEKFVPELGIHLDCRSSPVMDAEGNVVRIVKHLRDISEQKDFEARLQAERDYMYQIFDTMSQYIVVESPSYRTEFLNRAARERFGDLEGTICYEQLNRTTPCPQCPIEGALAQDSPFEPIRYTIEAFGRTMEGNATKLIHRDGTVSVLKVLDDVTERKAMEEKLKEMSLFDSLTGLYNRAFFEEEMKRLTDERYSPLSIIVCDINGLKLINDTMGHNKGDELVKDTARILMRCFRASDITSRIGGDEFAVLLPQSGEKIVRECVRRIRREIESYNHASYGFGLSISIGYAVEEEPCSDMNSVFKRADDAMYKEKLQQNHSSRNATIQALIKTLEARDHLTEGHGGRLCDYAQLLGKSVGLSGDQLTDLQLLARFHDLGKVGIPDSILFKQGPLTEEEFEEMKRHCEIGHRIALATSDLAPIAEYILKHHERWDGMGYPLGLSDGEIPLSCRILAIVDAYDAMTNDRPYRRAMPSKEAIAELRRCAGTQFDPELVDRFIGLLQDLNEELL